MPPRQSIMMRRTLMFRRDGGRVRARGEIRTGKGSTFRFEDTFESRGEEGAFRLSRDVRVVRAEKDDLGFGTRVSFGLPDSNDPKDYDSFAPGAWYKQNEKVPDHAIGADLGQRYFWYRETRFALPLFALQGRRSGEVVAVSRAKADIRASDIYERTFDCRTDPSFTYGSLGMSAHEGLSIDYVYPGTEGYNELMTPYRGSPYQYQFGFNRRYHPVVAGFTQKYSDHCPIFEKRRFPTGDERCLAIFLRCLSAADRARRQQRAL